jgi:hypothetical protein
MRAARPATIRREGNMMKAFQVWKDGSEWWEVREDGTFVATVDDRSQAADHGATAFIETDEPRFLVRDESGRGWVAEWRYTDFSAGERDYSEEGTDTDDAGNEIEFQTLGEWLDSSDAGDEFDNSDAMLTIIRIN